MRKSENFHWRHIFSIGWMDRHVKQQWMSQTESNSYFYTQKRDEWFRNSLFCTVIVLHLCNHRDLNVYFPLYMTSSVDELFVFKKWKNTRWCKISECIINCMTNCYSLLGISSIAEQISLLAINKTLMSKQKTRKKRDASRMKVMKRWIEAEKFPQLRVCFPPTELSSIFCLLLHYLHNNDWDED